MGDGSYLLVAWKMWLFSQSRVQNCCTFMHTIRNNKKFQINKKKSKTWKNFKLNDNIIRKRLVMLKCHFYIFLITKFSYCKLSARVAAFIASWFFLFIDQFSKSSMSLKYLNLIEHFFLFANFFPVIVYCVTQFRFIYCRLNLSIGGYFLFGFRFFYSHFSIYLN